MLAGLIRSPNRFSPFNNLKKAVRERNAVLARMHKLDFITEKQMVAASGLRSKDRAKSDLPHRRTTGRWTRSSANSSS